MERRNEKGTTALGVETKLYYSIINLEMHYASLCDS